LEKLGVAASSGAACSSAGSEPSHVLTAMGASRDEALCAVRLSLDPSTTEAQVRRVLEALPPELGPLMREMSEVAELA